MNVEAAHARSRLHVIMKTFAARYVKVIGHQMVHLSYIWNHILVQFGAVMVTYMRQKWKILVQSPGLDPPSPASGGENTFAD